jgi:hypothetical protein
VTWTARDLAGAAGSGTDSLGLFDVDAAIVVPDLSWSQFSRAKEQLDALNAGFRGFHSAIISYLQQHGTTRLHDMSGINCQFS